MRGRPPHVTVSGFGRIVCRSWSRLRCAALVLARQGHHPSDRCVGRLRVGNICGSEDVAAEDELKAIANLFECRLDVHVIYAAVALSAATLAMTSTTPASIT